MNRPKTALETQKMTVVFRATGERMDIFRKVK